MPNSQQGTSPVPSKRRPPPLTPPRHARSLSSGSPKARPVGARGEGNRDAMAPCELMHHHFSLTGAPNSTSARRAREPALVSPGSSTSATKRAAAIAPLGAGGAL